MPLPLPADGTTDGDGMLSDMRAVVEELLLLVLIVLRKWGGGVTRGGGVG